jgi:hypothetical protein
LAAARWTVLRFWELEPGDLVVGRIERAVREVAATQP